jgi:hypothetical protein
MRCRPELGFLSALPASAVRIDPDKILRQRFEVAGVLGKADP